MHPTGNPKSRTLCILRRFLSLTSKPNYKFCNFFHFRNKRLSSHLFLSSQTNNQVHRSPKYSPPSVHFMQQANTEASMFQTGQLCSDQLTLEATAGTAEEAIFQLQTHEATPSEKRSNLGKWPRFNSELPCCFSRDSWW